MSKDNMLEYLYKLQCPECPLGECCKQKREDEGFFITPCAKLIVSITIETI